MPNNIAAGVTAIISNPNVPIFTDRNFVIISPTSTVDLAILYVTQKEINESLKKFKIHNF